MNGFSNPNSPSLLDLQRQRLDALLATPAKSTEQSTRLADLVKQAGQAVVAMLTPGNAPRISTCTRQGQTLWKVYDPSGDRTLFFETETELRAWIDQRYYE